MAAKKLTKQELEDDGYRHIFRYVMTKSKHFDVFEAPGDAQVEPWCIVYFGNGHYFQSLRECLAYAHGRKFIDHYEIARIVEDRRNRYYRHVF